MAGAVLSARHRVPSERTRRQSDRRIATAAIGRKKQVKIMATVGNLAVNFSTNMASLVTDFEKTSKAVGKAASDITGSLNIL
jgi:hypothetical protein